MASADFCIPIPTPYDASSLRQRYRPPKVMRVTFPLISAASTTTVSVQVSGFEDNGLLTHCDCLLCDSCSSDQCFAFSFLQIPPRDGHPCRSANRSPCRADSGLSPPSHPASTTCTGTAPVGATRHTRRTNKKGLNAILPYHFGGRVFIIICFLHTQYVYIITITAPTSVNS